MEIKWLGHSCFLITGKDGIRIICDPFQANDSLRYHKIDMPADIVTISHDHYDHSCTDYIPGKYQVFKKAGSWSVLGVEIQGINTWHDEAGGRERGGNIIFCITLDGLKICHCGDLGHSLTPEILKEIGHVDVLCIPVGGKFTLNLSQANTVSRDVNPRIVIPMHYKTEYCDFAPNSVQEFIKNKENVRITDSSSITIREETLPKHTEIVVLKYAK